MSSYFQKTLDGTRIGQMVSRIARLETTVVRSRRQRCLLENNLIKDAEPQVQHPLQRRQELPLSEDHRYPRDLPYCGPKPVPSIAFPRMVYYRGAVDRRHSYYGPYPSAWAVKESITLLAKGISIAHL
ncbi:MAG: hypothetical protein R3E56_10130 [Burkholderiaceae bacterium]